MIQLITQIRTTYYPVIHYGEKGCPFLIIYLHDTVHMKKRLV